MQKPLDTNLKADLPVDWERDDIVSPSGTESGLSEQHGYNYLNKSVNDAHTAINKINEAFNNVQDNLSAKEVASSIADADTVPVVQTSGTVRRITFANLLAAIRTKFTTVFAALSHTHGNISNDGKLGTLPNQAVFTGAGGAAIAGTLPTAAGGTGVTDLNVNKLKRDFASDSLWQIHLSPSGNDSNTGLTESVPMKSIRAAVGRYGGLNRLQLILAPGTYTDTATVIISGSQHVTISGTSATPGAVVIAHPIIFQSADAYLYRVTFDLTASALTDPGVTFRQAKYNVQECVFKGKAAVHAGMNASLGSSGYVVGCTFQTGKSGAEIGSGASMTALNNSLASALEIGFNVNGGMLLSGTNVNSAGTQFTMYNSALIVNDGVLLNTTANTLATAEFIE